MGWGSREGLATDICDIVGRHVMFTGLLHWLYFICSLHWPGITSLLQFAVKDLHEAVRAGVVMNRATGWGEVGGGEGVKGRAWAECCGCALSWPTFPTLHPSRESVCCSAHCRRRPGFSYT